MQSCKVNVSDVSAEVVMVVGKNDPLLFLILLLIFFSAFKIINYLFKNETKTKLSEDFIASFFGPK